MTRRLLNLLLLLLLSSPAALLAQTPTPAAGDGERMPDPAAIVGAPAGAPLAGAALEVRTKEVSSLLRCPVCQGLSIFDSPSSMARKMKQQVGEFLARGFTQEQILTYFEKSYGESVRLQPPLRGINWIVWLAPLLLLTGGALFVWSRMKSMSRRAAIIPAEALTPGRQDDPALKPYLDRVRALARDDEPTSSATNAIRGD